MGEKTMTNVLKQELGQAERLGTNARSQASAGSWRLQNQQYGHLREHGLRNPVSMPPGSKGWPGSAGGEPGFGP